MFFYRDSLNELTLSEAHKYIDLFKTRDFLKLKRLGNYYSNKNEAIRQRVFEDKSKPNHKLFHSFSNYISTINTALFIGKPITYSSNDDLTDYITVLSVADEENVNYNLAINCSKYGYAVELITLDENTDLKMYVINNEQVVLIFDDDIKKNLKYAIRFWKTENADCSFTEWIEIYSKNFIKRYKDNILVYSENNLFSNIPVIVYYNNDDVKGDSSNVLSLIDAYDFTESDSINENDYFNNAYLYLNTDDVDVTDVAKMKENRVLYGIDLNPEFILKNSSDNETLKSRLVSDIHKLSFTPDLSDNNFANNVSGVAMKFKLLGTMTNIQAKQRKFATGIAERNRVIFDYMTVKFMTIPESIKPVFSDTLPTNTLELAQMLNQLRGLVSNETLLEQVPFVSDIDLELERINDEEESIDVYE